MVDKYGKQYLNITRKKIIFCLAFHDEWNTKISFLAPIAITIGRGFGEHYSVLIPFIKMFFWTVQMSNRVRWAKLSVKCFLIPVLYYRMIWKINLNALNCEYQQWLIMFTYFLRTKKSIYNTAWCNSTEKEITRASMWNPSNFKIERFSLFSLVDKSCPC